MPRPSSYYLDNLIDSEPVRVLDHGFVRVVDYMGNQAAIIRAARQSYSAEPTARTPEQDRTLLRYLMRHAHTSPLEMCELSVQMKLPIFVARQIVRHRTANINELSGRYSVLDREFYIPEVEQMCAQSTANKQGRGAKLSEALAKTMQKQMLSYAERTFDFYDFLLTDNLSVPLSRELARINLPLSTYTTWTWKIDLHNLLHFLALRLDGHAQYETRVYADVLWGWVQGWVPDVASAFLDYRLEAVRFSRPEQAAIRYLLLGQARDDAEAMLGDSEIARILPNERELSEFRDKFLRLLNGP